MPWMAVSSASAVSSVVAALLPDAERGYGQIGIARLTPEVLRASALLGLAEALGCRRRQHDPLCGRWKPLYQLALFW